MKKQLQDALSAQVRAAHIVKSAIAQAKTASAAITIDAESKDGNSRF